MGKKLLSSLVDIQQRLDAPKDKFNNFGKYKYRSLEGIEASIKPLLKEHGCGIRFADEIVEHCGRTFLKTTLYFFNADGEEISTTAEAEHAVELKGMDKSQISGAASSYARKYAMNAMFAIDDTRDADTDEFHTQTNAPAVAPKATTTRSRKTANPPVIPTPQIPPIATSQPTGTILQIEVNDRYGGIKNALNGVIDKEGIMSLYIQHKNEVDSNPEIKKLFSERKHQLNIA